MRPWLYILAICALLGGIQAHAWDHWAGEQDQTQAHAGVCIACKLAQNQLAPPTLFKSDQFLAQPFLWRQEKASAQADRPLITAYRSRAPPAGIKSFS